MDERDARRDKMKRIAVGATVGGVLLFVFLVIVLIIQFVQIGVNNAEIGELEQKIQEYREQTKYEEDILKEYSDADTLYREAVKWGWKS